MTEPLSPPARGLSLRNIAHAYRKGRPVLRDVSLEIPCGSIHCLLGLSGCGKTTLLRLIAGLEPLQSGTISFNGTPIAPNTPPEARSVGFVFQDYALFPHLSARRNVMYALSGRWLARFDRALKREADAWLARVGLAGFERAMPHTLSGGQQQRVALARALARRPAVMLLDEPFSGLDVELREQVRAMTIGLLREAGVATLMVTHDPREADAVADTVSTMREGHIESTKRVDRPALASA